MKIKEAIIYNPIAKYLLFYPTYFLGRLNYSLSGKTPSASFFSFRRLYCLTRGAINTSLSSRINRAVGKFDIDEDGSDVVPHFDQEVALNAIREQGFYVLPELLDTRVVGSLNKLAKRCPSRIESENEYNGHEEIFDCHHPKGTRYFINESCLLNSPEVQSVLSSTSLISLAQAFLGCKPIIDLVLMWWLTDYQKYASSQSAQLFHFDMDRPKFLKVFLYLTDVGKENAPHTYALGSNVRKPGRLYRARRFSDKDIYEHYQVKELTGRAGTIMIVDTSGFHKGGVITGDPRLLLQIEYTNSLFGATYPHFEISNAEEQIKHMKNKYPRVFQLFKLLDSRA